MWGPRQNPGTLTPSRSSFLKEPIARGAQAEAGTFSTHRPPTLECLGNFHQPRTPSRGRVNGALRNKVHKTSPSTMRLGEASSTSKEKHLRCGEVGRQEARGPPGPDGRPPARS